MLDRILFFPSQVSNLGGEGLGEGESGKPPRPASLRGSKKGRTTPLYLEGLKLAHLGFRQSIYITAGNFYSSVGGKKEW